VNSSDTWLGVASSCSDSAGRIGSTRPMPIKEMTQANATAHTARGWRNGLAGAACRVMGIVVGIAVGVAVGDEVGDAPPPGDRQKDCSVRAVRTVAATGQSFR